MLILNISGSDISIEQNLKNNEIFYTSSYAFNPFAVVDFFSGKIYIPVLNESLQML